jgi:hypothetical protein
LTLPFKNTADAGYRITEHTCHRMMLSSTDGTSTGAIACGTYPLDDAFGRSSVWLFLAKMAGRPITVAGRLFTETCPMVDPDNGDSRIVTIPRWAARILPASGTDCHAQLRAGDENNPPVLAVQAHRQEIDRSPLYRSMRLALTEYDSPRLISLAAICWHPSLFTTAELI